MTTRLALVLVTLAFASVASADGDKEKADALFKQGKKLMAEKRFADACEAFENSFKLDPGIGTELNTAKCYEEWGKLARAYRAYQKAEDMAKEAGDKRTAKIKQLADQLDSSVPRLTIKVTAATDVDALTVTIDGNAVDKKLLGKPQLVDPGPHVVEYQGDGGAKKNKVVPVERGGASEITLDVPAVAKVKKGGEGEGSGSGSAGGEGSGSGSAVGAGEGSGSGSGSGSADHPNVTPDPGKKQRLAAYITAGAGVVAIGISTGITLSARSKYQSALSAHCMNMTDMCDATGLTDTHDARHEANIATIVFAVGAAAVAGGVVLYLLAPHAKHSDEHALLYVTPTASPDGGGVVLGGRF